MRCLFAVNRIADFRNSSRNSTNNHVVFSARFTLGVMHQLGSSKVGLPQDWKVVRPTHLVY